MTDVLVIDDCHELHVRKPKNHETAHLEARNYCVQQRRWNNLQNSQHPEVGAGLEVASQFGIPDDFKLVIGTDNRQRSCRVAWRKANLIGVAFD